MALASELFHAASLHPRPPPCQQLQKQSRVHTVGAAHRQAGSQVVADDQVDHRQDGSADGSEGSVELGRVEPCNFEVGSLQMKQRLQERQ